MPEEIVMPPFHGRNTGFEAGTAGTPSPLRWFLRLLYPKHHTCRTTAAYRFYQSSHAVCRFGRNGNSWFAVGCYLLHPSNHRFAPAVRRSLGRCRYRCRGRLSGFPARGGCRTTGRPSRRREGMGGTVGGAGGGAQQKSGRVKTTLKSLLLRAILLKAMVGFVMKY